MLILLCLLLLTSQVLANSFILNLLVDQALDGLNALIQQTGKASISIPALNYQWKYPWLFYEFSGHIHCKKGFAKSLATFRRTGNVVMSTAGNQLTLRVAFGLETLEASFQDCHIKARHLFTVSQHITASVSSNSVVAQATVIKDDNNCTANLDYISLTDLGKIKISTGYGLLHSIEDLVTNWALSHIHGKVVATINSKLLQLAYANFPKDRLCTMV